MPFKIALLTLIFLLLLFACGSKSSDPMPSLTARDTVFVKTNGFFIAHYTYTDLQNNADFGSFSFEGVVQDAALDEISGIAASRTNPDKLWVEEDSKNENKIYLLDRHGLTLGSFALKNAFNIDWEDMAIGGGIKENQSYIYLGDVGNNYSLFPIRSIYRIPEPVLSGKTIPVNETISAFDKLDFKYPDGIKDCETLLIDPLTKDLYLVSKEENQAVVYWFPFPQEASKFTVLGKIGVLPLGQICAGDISSDGKEILLKDYGTVY
ncbi:MAG: hypothetical protein H7Y04_07730, partial [Verrucomicrobia bacterium]|nr:hypothetical protein [Cytophagales bacterium]